MISLDFVVLHWTVFLGTIQKACFEMKPILTNDLRILMDLINVQPNRYAYLKGFTSPRKKMKRLQGTVQTHKADHEIL